MGGALKMDISRLMEAVVAEQRQLMKDHYLQHMGEVAAAHCENCPEPTLLDMVYELLWAREDMPQLADQYLHSQIMNPLYAPSVQAALANPALTGMSGMYYPGATDSISSLKQMFSNPTIMHRMYRDGHLPFINRRRGVSGSGGRGGSRRLSLQDLSQMIKPEYQGTFLKEALDGSDGYSGQYERRGRR